MFDNIVIFSLFRKMVHNLCWVCLLKTEPKAKGDLIVWDSSRHPSVRLSVRPSTLSNMNISETSWPIIIKFHQKHHWGRGMTALDFG